MDKKSNQISIQINPRYEPKSVDSYYQEHDKSSKNMTKQIEWDRDRGRKEEIIPLHHYLSNHSNSTWQTSPYREEKSNWLVQVKGHSRAFLSAAAAIAVGLLLGMLVLSIFSSLEDGGSSQEKKQTSMIDKLKGNESQANHSSQQEMTSADKDSNAMIVPTGQVHNGVVQLPARSYYVIQAGVFSELQAAQSILQEHQGKGLPGLLLKEAQSYKLYIGATGSKELSKRLGEVYKAQGIEIYVKEHISSEIKDVVVEVEENLLATLPAFLVKADQLMALLGEVSAHGLEVEGYELTATDWNEIQELHRTLLTEGKKLFAAWPGQGKGAGEHMLHPLTQGVNALETYRKQKHQSYLWQVQEAILHYILGYEKFISTLQ